MIIKVKQGSDQHKNWLLLRDKVISGLKYSWRRDVVDSSWYISISFDEDLTKDRPSGVWESHGVETTNGNIIHAIDLAEVIGSDTLKLLVENTLRCADVFKLLNYNEISSSVSQITMGFHWGVVEDTVDWSDMGRKLRAYQKERDA